MLPSNAYHIRESKKQNISSRFTVLLHRRIWDKKQSNYLWKKNGSSNSQVLYFPILQKKRGDDITTKPFCLVGRCYQHSDLAKSSVHLWFFLSLRTSSPHHPTATDTGSWSGWFLPSESTETKAWVYLSEHGPKEPVSIVAALSCLKNTGHGFPPNESNRGSWVGMILSPWWYLALSGHIFLLSWLEEGGATGT